MCRCTPNLIHFYVIFFLLVHRYAVLVHSETPVSLRSSAVSTYTYTCPEKGGTKRHGEGTYASRCGPTATWNSVLGGAENLASGLDPHSRLPNVLMQNVLSVPRFEATTGECWYVSGRTSHPAEFLTCSQFCLCN